MASRLSKLIHPTAVIAAEAELAPDVQVGPLAVIEGHVKVGSGCTIHGRAHLIGPMRLGANNQIFPGAVLGGPPQHLQFGGEPTSVEIGHGNIIRENVTIHRGTTSRWRTQLGDQNFLMAGSHVGHDCIVGNRCILTNNSLLAGHVELGEGAIVSGNSAVHQFCRVGRLAFLSGLSGTTKDVPPFIVQQNINQVVGINLVGMRRAGMKTEEIAAIRQLYHIVYLQGNTVPVALARVEQELGNFAAVREYVEFVRSSKRGIAGVSGPSRYDYEVKEAA
jgi:UDP-N-acetylglucosamine acyltransferase